MSFSLESAFNKVFDPIFFFYPPIFLFLFLSSLILPSISFSVIGSQEEDWTFFFHDFQIINQVVFFYFDYFSLLNEEIRNDWATDLQILVELFLHSCFRSWFLEFFKKNENLVYLIVVLIARFCHHATYTGPLCFS